MKNNLIRYCVSCGGECETRLLDNRTRQVCAVCGHIYYEQWKVSAGACITQDGKLLLVQRKFDPWKGCWHMPAGYVEVDEDPAAAAEREALEETGLQVKVNHLVDVYSDFEDPRGNVLVLIYVVDVTGGVLILTPETLSAGYYSAEQVNQLQLAGPSARESIEAWIHASNVESVD